jgi:Flp pilus assembly pilin Flp
MPPAAPSFPIERFVGDGDGSAMAECAVIVGVIGVILGLVALVLDRDISALFSYIGIVFAGIPLPG